VRRLVHLVIALRLEEEVADLPAGHGEQPAHQRRRRGAGEYQHIGAEKASRADEVQRLIDPAVVVIAMIVPPLHLESLPEAVHHGPFLAGLRSRQRVVPHLGMPGQGGLHEYHPNDESEHR
jgi:hypothetical protein